MSGELTQHLQQIGKATQFGCNGRKLCGAKAKRTGLPCKQPAMTNGKCRLHGGKTPKHSERNKAPRTINQWQKAMRKMQRAGKQAKLNELQSNPPAIDWSIEGELLATGLLHKVPSDIERYELRQAFAEYHSGAMPWIAWQRTLEHLGLA